MVAICWRSWDARRQYNSRNLKRIQLGLGLLKHSSEVKTPRFTGLFAGGVPTLFGTTIFLSAFLLFSVEPLIAKRILPWFGGSAAVWSTCLVFYQTALLLGYVYARLLTRYLTPRRQVTIHVVLLLVSLALLPIGPGQRWKPGPAQDPTWLILEMLTLTIGLPFVVLSSTSPLLQDWIARGGYKTPYRLFALSNLASFVALLGYPLFIEPLLDTRSQSLIWSAGYAVFIVLCGFSAWRSRNRGGEKLAESAPERIDRTQTRWWFLLSACGSMLLLSVTNHITENVAAVPLLWVLPLAIYLLTFVLIFGPNRVYKRAMWLRLLAVALGTLGYAIYDIHVTEVIQVSLPIALLSLFVCCMFCHGELSRLRPDSRNLTDFYMMLSLGGAAGAIFVGIIAPRVFSGIYELPLTLVLTAGLALLLTWRDGAWPLRLLWIGVTGCMIVVLGANVKGYRENALSVRRSFYGSLRVVQSPHPGEEQTRTLFHGTVEHGAEFLLPPRQLQPTTYYGSDSGVGIVLRECFQNPKRVGVVGLGVGTIAAYAQAGDSFRFYEINGQVIDIAESLFFYLREARAEVQIVEGDARLSIERESGPPFDVLALDAFSGDAIPVHLLTKEAVALYLKHLKPDGVLAFHVSNQYLDLAPIVGQIAKAAGYEALLVKSRGMDEDLTLPTDWVLVTRNALVLKNADVTLRSAAIPLRDGLRLWTDDYNNLFRILNAPHWHELRPLSSEPGR
ncbi:MAG: fused MFS/spermidine synthase [Acidobacteriaceae bacterium]|nr:fused MFS/spermidine synthase [Acidobacteriaceae bacterium]MBV9780619.1 fused MFS/spermidine synthase [Acidobacteriaceae bacterium]